MLLYTCDTDKPQIIENVTYTPDNNWNEILITPSNDMTPFDGPIKNVNDI